MNYREHLRDIRKRPALFFGGFDDPTYEQWWSYFIGLNVGSEGRFLDGFNQYVVLLYGGYGELGAKGLIRMLALGEDISDPLTEEDGRVAVDALFQLLDEFLAEVEGSGSRDRVKEEHLLWAMDTDSDALDMRRYRRHPPPEMVSVQEAAAILGVSRREVFDRIAQRLFSVFRVGSEVMVRATDVESPGIGDE